MAEETEPRLFAIPIVHTTTRRGTVYVEAQTAAEAAGLFSEQKWINLEYENDDPDVESYLPLESPVLLDDRPLKRCYKQPPPSCDQ